VHACLEVTNTLAYYRDFKNKTYIIKFYNFEPDEILISCFFANSIKIVLSIESEDRVHLHVKCSSNYLYIFGPKGRGEGRGERQRWTKVILI